MTTKTQINTESLHARISREILNDLNTIASDMGRSRNWIFNEALKQFLDIHRWQIELINERLNKSEGSDAILIPHEKIMKNQEKKLKAKLSI